jgi:type II secretory pathway pseudopilin PulG
MFSWLKEERGQALVLTTLIVMLLAVIGTGLVSIGTRQKSFSATEVRLENAYFAANAGLTRALTVLENADQNSEIDVINLFDSFKPEYSTWDSFKGDYGNGEIYSVVPLPNPELKEETDDYYKWIYTIESVGKYPKGSVLFSTKTLSGKVYIYQLKSGGGWIASLSPAIPSGLSAEPGNQQVTLSWLANTDKGLGGYKIYRSLALEGEYEKIQQVGKVTSWTDTGLINGTTYYYKISAYSVVGLESDKSLPAWATPFNPAPAAPTGLTATAGNQKVTLQWNANSEEDLAGYKIYRSLTEGGTYTLIHTAGKVTSWVDTGLTNGTTYYYKISAYNNASLESDKSLPAWATPFNSPVVWPTEIYGGIWTDSLNVKKECKIFANIYCSGAVDGDKELVLGSADNPKNLYANGDIEIHKDGKIFGNIYSKQGSIKLWKDFATISSSDTIQAKHDVEIKKHSVTGSIRSLSGNVNIAKDTQINDVYASGNVTLAQEA